MTKHRITAADGLNVRTMRTTASNVPIGLLPFGSIVDVLETVGEWRTIGPVQVSGVTLASPVRAYCFAAHTEPVADPPPATLSEFRLGVHVINDFGAAETALAAGAPALTIMDGKLEAVQLARAYPQARIVYRRYLANSWPTPAEMVQLLGAYSGDPPIAFVGLNEGDSAAETGSPTGILKRAAWDVDVATRIKAIQPNATYYAGSYGHGNPDITRDDICAAMRQGYAAAYNSGLIGFDLHNYTFQKRRSAHPPGDARIIGPEWFERRADWFFTKCGFDPRVRRIIAAETGVEAGHGGFNWANYTEQQYREWQSDVLAIMRAPLIVAGVSYPSPYEFATVYQFGANSRWAGYDVRRYLPVMREGWA